ncbi:autotransporter outer membrane beta-barrel domain-containing protein [Enterobacter quasiroggenkampii]|uniref:Autotransporter outer membrane beta-barrel domain-containing protein n=1 Tax=Enterobacter quasiroggenkampii TaxID=2497436 RepID=A0ABY8E5S6_9ENTR|nr:autotransporter outer membrane beta-barrel domain-containing protein [Enterobacter quasiroggenkampii]WFC84532.1 autotransporter outer membrane beta-barrel domain-containing protein [Enterobacter quasiroggenkampii]
MRFKAKPIAIFIGTFFTGFSVDLVAGQNNYHVEESMWVEGVILDEDNDYQYVAGTVENTVIDAGHQKITQRGVAYNTIINGGKQSIVINGTSNTIAINSGGTLEIDGAGATSNDVTINDGGTQLLTSGTTNNTIINKGGTMYVGGSLDSTGAIANSTTVDGGVQIIGKTGTANDTTVSGGTQYVYADGVANGTSIITEGTNNGTQSVQGGVANNTVVNGISANISVSDGGIANNVTVKRGNAVVGTSSGYRGDGSINGINLTGRYASLLVTNGGTASNVLIDGGKQTVNGADATTDTVRLMSGSQVLVYGGTASHTYIEGGKQIVKANSKTINTTIISGQSLLETGALAEGTTSVHQNGELLMEAGARATDVSLDGGILSITDLNDNTSSLTPAQVDTLTMSGGTVSFLRDSEGEFAALNITELNGTGNFLFNSSLAERNSNFVTIEQGSGHFGIAVSDSGKEISDHTDLTVNLIHEQGGDIDFEMVTASGRSTRAVDGGTYMYTLFSQQNKDGLNGGNVWYLGAMTDEPGGGENPGGGDNGNTGGNGNGSKKPMTTPATDAILAMSNAGLNVIHSELDGLRTYRTNLDKTGPESNVWGHYLGSKNNIDTSNGAAYQLNQNGMEIGADTRADFERGSLVTGAFMSYSDNKVKHDRGGKSKIDSYGLGLYATWFDASGFYVDGVVKGNRLNNKLSAVMTNGGKTSGDWKQYALSTAVEGGYQLDLKDDVSITPYGRLAFVQMTSEDVKLSNGMKGNTGTPRSVTGEAGAKIAGKFNIGSTEFKPYLSAAVVQEFANSNEVTINERNRFDNNVKGTSGKYGLGASVNVGKDVTLYGEANYRQGSQIETPIQGVAGVRIGF